jgi:hypothetical protein
MFPVVIERSLPTSTDVRSRGRRRRRWAERAWDTFGLAVAVLTLEDDFDDLDWDLGDDEADRSRRRRMSDPRACETRPIRPAQPHCPDARRTPCGGRPAA